MRVLLVCPEAYEGRGRGGRQVAKTRTEREIAAARALLGDKRLVAFLKAALGKPKPRVHVTSASRIACKTLARDPSLDALFAPWVMPELGKFRSGFDLTASAQPDGRYLVCFGCNAGGNCGDGGEWLVDFTPTGRVRSIEQLSYWIA